MSVYIPGMEMPTSCYDCPMCYDLMECSIGNPRIGFYKDEMRKEPFDFCNERHPRCPLVPVPDHGRLGDLDKLNKLIDESYPMTDRVDVHNGYAICQELIKQLPTVIPAEEGA